MKRENSDENQRTSRGEKDGVSHKGPRTRPKPGAALALAKRESAMIVPGQGHKITFIAYLSSYFWYLVKWVITYNSYSQYLVSTNMIKIPRKGGC